MRGLQLSAEWVRDLPQGAVVATAMLVDAVQVTGPGFAAGTVLCRRRDGSEEEIIAEPFGWYRESRWVWRLVDVERLAEPVHARGYQGLWEWSRDRPGRHLSGRARRRG